jgi:hypothetical protein
MAALLLFATGLGGLDLLADAQITETATKATLADR